MNKKLLKGNLTWKLILKAAKKDVYPDMSVIQCHSLKELQKSKNCIEDYREKFFAHNRRCSVVFNKALIKQRH